MNTINMEFAQGCPQDEPFFEPAWTKLHFSICNIANTLYARCEETHETINSKPKTQDLYNIIRKYWINYFISKGYSPIDCVIPTDEKKRKLYIIAKTERTLRMKRLLIEAGVLKK